MFSCLFYVTVVMLCLIHLVKHKITNDECLMNFALVKSKVTSDTDIVQIILILK